MERIADHHRTGRVLSEVHRLDGGARLYVPTIPDWELFADQLQRQGKHLSAVRWRDPRPG